MNDLKVRANGLDFHLVDYGGSGEVVFCVHGLTANSRFWDAVALALTTSYRVIAIDLRGRGDSCKPEEGYSLDEHAKDLNTVLEVLSIDRVIFMGHSLGAIIGCCFAANYKEKVSHLILVDGGADFEPLVIDLLQSSLDRLDRIFPSLEDYLQFMRKSPFFSDWNRYVEQYFLADVMELEEGSVRSKVTRNVVAQELQALQEVSINRFHEHIRVPILILWAPQCLLHPTAYLITKEKGEELAGRHPFSRFSEITGSNHFSIVFSKHEALVREVKEFLSFP
ncbi:alpha/beta fold hydrolase [Ammoniphilus sp. YIM 78166]|uniref:alpha/beta fold hydrolase n=1 Tax=Ammoniphilus sp. YIM 78166 TaxID=1644106 RepID=UPI00106F3150|nr:alpha/beta hydrolase [Ammoniphilus sp. YIM 78166]